MSNYNPPTENITSFNTLLFNQPEVILTQAEADLLYLSKVSSTISTSGSTTFSNAVSVGGNFTTSAIKSGTVAGANVIFDNLTTGTLAIGSATTNTSFAGTINSTLINTVNTNAVSIGSAVSAQIRTVNVGTGNTIGNDDVVLGNGAIAGGSFCVAIGRVASTAYNTRSVAIGANATCAFDDSTALGNGAIATAANQVVLGRSTETVIIPNRIQFTPSSYSFPFASSQSLGYYLKATGTGTTLTSGITSTILTTASIPIGVWRIDFSVQNTVGASGAGTITQAQSYVSTTLNGNNTTAVPFTGSIVRSHTSEVYGNNDIQLITSSFTYQQSTAGVLHLNAFRVFSTGTYSFTGELSITRLA